MYLYVYVYIYIYIYIAYIRRWGKEALFYADYAQETSLWILHYARDNVIPCFGTSAAIALIVSWVLNVRIMTKFRSTAIDMRQGNSLLEASVFAHTPKAKFSSTHIPR